MHLIRLIIIRFAMVLIVPVVSAVSYGRSCVDTDTSCSIWIVSDSEQCEQPNSLANLYCQRSCQHCNIEIPSRYDLKRVPQSLKSVSFLIGRWRSEFGGKTAFPTIPRFTYGEEIDFSLMLDENHNAANLLNYSAFAWDNYNMKEMHSEYGFITVDNLTDTISLNTVMSNGFITIEEGEEYGHSIELRMRRIGRISFSHDLPVRMMQRTWTLLDPLHLESRLLMGTYTHSYLIEHTRIVYEKIFP